MFPNQKIALEFNTLACDLMLCTLALNYSTDALHNEHDVPCVCYNVSASNNYFYNSFWMCVHLTSRLKTPFLFKMKRGRNNIFHFLTLVRFPFSKLF